MSVACVAGADCFSFVDVVLLSEFGFHLFLFTFDCDEVVFALEDEWAAEDAVLLLESADLSLYPIG